eukprot:1159482-Pelagomonas_calceolata.AAC.2
MPEAAGAATADPAGAAGVPNAGAEEGLEAEGGPFSSAADETGGLSILGFLEEGEGARWGWGWGWLTGCTVGDC